jgi:hypothetical protein
MDGEGECPWGLFPLNAYSAAFRPGWIIVGNAMESALIG